jgi:hypothetical protein
LIFKVYLFDVSIQKKSLIKTGFLMNEEITEKLTVLITLYFRYFLLLTSEIDKAKMLKGMTAKNNVVSLMN